MPGGWRSSGPEMRQDVDLTAETRRDRREFGGGGSVVALVPSCRGSDKGGNTDSGGSQRIITDSSDVNGTGIRPLVEAPQCEHLNPGSPPAILPAKKSAIIR
jgi:hypothetical protein